MKPRESTYYLLQDAYRSFRKKRYNEACIILEQVVIARPEHSYPYFLLAVAYLFTSKLDMARRVMEAGTIKDRNYIPLVQLDAFLNMKGAASFDEALSCYIRFMEAFPRDRGLRRAVARLRNSSDFDYFQRKARMEDFVEIKGPPKSLRATGTGNHHVDVKVRNRPGFHFSFRVIIFALPVVVALSSILFFILFRPFRSTEHAGKATLADTSVVDNMDISGPASGLINTLNRTRTREFYYSTEKLLSDFNGARHLIKKGQYNRAVTILNRISESNASFAVREKAGFLTSFIMNIDERDYEYISFSDLSRNAWLYRGYAIRWKGKVANLNIKEKSQSFTMLVDYGEADVFSGAASVFYGGDNPRLENGVIVDLKAVFVNAVGDENRFYLKAHRVDVISGGGSRD